MPSLPATHNQVELQALGVTRSSVDDAEHPELASQTLPSSNSDIGIVRVSVPCSGDKSFLYGIPIRFQDLDNHVVKNLNRWHTEMVNSKFIHGSYSWLWKPVIEFGALSMVDSSNHELARGPVEVVITDRFRSTELTAGFTDSSLLHNTQPFAQTYAGVMMGSNSQQTIVIRQELRKEIVTLLVIGTVLGSVVAGVIVGVVTNNVGNGIACSAGLVGILSVLLLVLFWMLK